MAIENTGFAFRERELAGVLGGMTDPQERLAWVVERARGRPGLAAAERIPANEVKGCTSRLWLVAEQIDGRCRFRCDSESAILRALGGLLCELYDGLDPGEVVRCEPAVLDRCGLLRPLTENRRRTVARFREALRAFAAGQR